MADQKRTSRSSFVPIKLGGAIRVPVILGDSLYNWIIREYFLTPQDQKEAKSEITKELDPLLPAVLADIVTDFESLSLRKLDLPWLARGICLRGMIFILFHLAKLVNPETKTNQKGYVRPTQAQQEVFSASKYPVLFWYGPVEVDVDTPLYGKIEAQGDLSMFDALEIGAADRIDGDQPAPFNREMFKEQDYWVMSYLDNVPYYQSLEEIQTKYSLRYTLNEQGSVVYDSDFGIAQELLREYETVRNYSKKVRNYSKKVLDQQR